MILSILIPSTTDRQQMLENLMAGINRQIQQLGVEGSVQILTEIDNREITTGAKRNLLLQKAEGEYVVFVDSDDEVSYDYVSEILKATLDKPDVIGINGYMTTNGENRENFKISKDFLYIAIKDATGKTEYLRHNNHLCPIKREIALKIGFKNQYFAEDYDYAVRLKESGLIQTETYIEKDLYHYKFMPQK